MMSMGPMVGSVLLIPVVYAVLKIVAGILVLKYGKRYADRVKEEERR